MSVVLNCSSSIEHCFLATIYTLLGTLDYIYSYWWELLCIKWVLPIVHFVTMYPAFSCMDACMHDSCCQWAMVFPVACTIIIYYIICFCLSLFRELKKLMSTQDADLDEVRIFISLCVMVVVVLLLLVCVGRWVGRWMYAGVGAQDPSFQPR